MRGFCKWRNMRTSSPLPSSDSSLTKYITLQEHYESLRTIESDTSIETLRVRFGADTFATARKRYLLEHDGLILRDRLIVLLQQEGSFTNRVKMVMYFLFMLRESRYRNFICNEVADSNGVWHIDAFASTTATVPDVGGRKAFTNLRRMLVHAGLLADDSAYTVSAFPRLDMWFSEGVEIAAQHITSPEDRQRFLNAPQADLLRRGIHGLLNAPRSIISGLVGPLLADTTADFLPQYSSGLGRLGPVAGGFREWVKASPIKRESLSGTAIISNPALLERANAQHFLLEKRMADICKESGCLVKESLYVDLLAQKGGMYLMFEMKSCTYNTLRSQVRRGISQLLEYRYLHRQDYPNVRLCLVLERRPAVHNEWLVDFAETLGIGVVWLTNLQEFSCREATRLTLKQFLSAVDSWSTT